MPETKNMAEALIAFHRAVPTIHENAKSFHGKFANLAGVLSAIHPALREAGLAVSHMPCQIDGKPGLRTTLLHVSGENMSNETQLIIANGKNVTQEWGKAMTYQRRYGLLAVLGLAIGVEDNDADADDLVPQPAKPTPTQPSTNPAAISPEQLQELLDIIPALPREYVGPMLKAFSTNFKTGKAKVSDCITTVEHFNWFQNYMANNPT